MRARDETLRNPPEKEHGMRVGVLTTPVAATFPMDQWAQAIERVDQPARGGKILLSLGEP